MLACMPVGIHLEIPYMCSHGFGRSPNHRSQLRSLQYALTRPTLGTKRPPEGLTDSKTFIDNNQPASDWLPWLARKTCLGATTIHADIFCCSCLRYLTTHNAFHCNGARTSNHITGHLTTPVDNNSDYRHLGAKQRIRVAKEWV